MIKIISIIFLFCTHVYAVDFKLEKVIEGFKKPWSLTFLDKENLLITDQIILEAVLF